MYIWNYMDAFDRPWLGRTDRQSIFHVSSWKIWQTLRYHHQFNKITKMS